MREAAQAAHQSRLARIDELENVIHVVRRLADKEIVGSGERDASLLESVVAMCDLSTPPDEPNRIDELEAENESMRATGRWSAPTVMRAELKDGSRVEVRSSNLVAGPTHKRLLLDFDALVSGLDGHPSDSSSARVHELEAHVVELRAALANPDRQWVYSGNDDTCPDCGDFTPKHKPDCAYVAIMAKTDPAR